MNSAPPAEFGTPGFNPAGQDNCPRLTEQRVGTEVTKGAVKAHTDQGRTAKRLFRSGNNPRFGDLFLDPERIVTELRVLGLFKECIQSAPVVHGTKRRGRYTQPEALSQRLRHQCDIIQIWQEPALGPVVGMADVIANQWTLSGKFAAARH